MRLSASALVLLTGCGFGLSPEPADEPEDTRAGETGRRDTGVRDTGVRDTGRTDTVDTGTDTEDSATDTGSGSRTPTRGDLVLSEVMCDPAAVADSLGEWVELANVSAHALDLTGLQLGDDNLDLTTIIGAPTLAAGAFALLCADDSRAANGGVTCAATYKYGSSGGSFTLANAGDEVNLLAADGTPLDSMAYSTGFAKAGVSMGVAPGQLTPNGNDAVGAWCPQTARLSGGDSASPGEANAGC